MRTENTPGIQQGGHAVAWGMSDTDWVHPNLIVVFLYVGRQQESTEVADFRLPMWKAFDVSHRKVMAAGNTA
jgi:hypothetical protein